MVRSVCGAHHSWAAGASGCLRASVLVGVCVGDSMMDAMPRRKWVRAWQRTGLAAETARARWWEGANPGRNLTLAKRGLRKT